MQSYPFTSQVTYDEQGLPLYDRAVNSEFLRDVFKQYFSDGVFYSGNSACLQVAADTGMQVKVSPGACHIQGAMGIEYYQRTLVVQAAGAQDRIDTVVARLDLSVDARKIDLYVRQGTPGESPSAPALTRDSTTWELGLANLFIAKNTSKISQERITDTRLDTDRCGMVAAAVQPPFDTEEFFSQLNAAIAAHQQTADNQIADINSEWESTLSGINTEWDGWKDTTDEDFAAWFQHIKDQLDEDAAGHLQLQVDEINDTLATGAITTYQHRKLGTEHHLIGKGPNGKAQMTADVDTGDTVVLHDCADVDGLVIEGKTTQAGTGDPSPDNIRPISGVGMYDQCVVFDGSEDEGWQLAPTGKEGKYRLQITQTPQVSPVAATSAAPIKSSLLRTISATGTWNNQAGVAAQGDNIIVYSDKYQTLEDWREFLSLNPLTIWYQSVNYATHTGPWYTVVGLSQDPYRAVGFELTQPLFDGDTLQVNVPSGCDQMVVLDGTESWMGFNSQSPAAYAGILTCDLSVAMDATNDVLFSSQYKGIGYLYSPIGIEVGACCIVPIATQAVRRFCVRVASTVVDVDEFKTYLSQHPLTIFYRSVNYTEEKDIPVVLETHAMTYEAFDGTENWQWNPSPGWAYRSQAYKNHKAGTPTQSSHYISTGDSIPSAGQITINNAGSLIVYDTAWNSVSNTINYFENQHSAGTPVQIAYELAAPVEYARLYDGTTLPAYMGTEDFGSALDGEPVSGKWLTFVQDGAQVNFKGGGGLSSSKLAAADAEPGEVLEGVKFYAGDKTLKTGMMPNQGAKTAALNAGESYAIPKGWHNGSGKVTANSLASQTSANAENGDIISGKTAWVNGSKRTGALQDLGREPKGSGCTLYNGGVYIYFGDLNSRYALSKGVWYPQEDIKNILSFDGSGSSGNKSGDYSEIYRNESNETREIQARSHASASISGKTVTITVHAEAYQRANDIPSLSGTKSSVDYSFSFTIS